MTQPNKISTETGPMGNLTLAVGLGNILYTLSTEPSGSYHRRKLDVEDVSDTVRLIEEAVYAVPSLIGDYKKVDIIIPCERYTIIPDDIADDSEALRGIAAAMWPAEVEDSDLVIDRTGGGVALLTLVEHRLANFVTRTFQRATIVNRMARVIESFLSQSKPVNLHKLYVNYSRETSVDVVVVEAERVIAANTFEISKLLDAVYYIMAVASDCKFDMLEDEMSLTGNRELVEALLPQLKEYVNSVTRLMLGDAADTALPIELQNRQ